jgi:hypothetical protein
VNEVLAAVLYPAFCRPKLRPLMEFARNVLISATCLKHKTVFRFAFPRSDLSRHHIEINPGNLPVPQRFKVLILLCTSVAHMMRIVRSPVSKDRPGDSRHFVSQGCAPATDRAQDDHFAI